MMAMKTKADFSYTQSNLPSYLSVRDVSVMLDVTPQMVRRYCANGDIEAKRRLGNKGQWMIHTDQFLGSQDLENLLRKQDAIKQDNIHMIKTILEE